MATKLFLRSLGGGLGDYSNGNRNGDVNAAVSMWTARKLSTVAGSSVDVFTTATISGPTGGKNIVGVSTDGYVQWYSEPLAADVTISGSITWNIWAAENNMSANVAINGMIEAVDCSAGGLTLIDKTARTTELAVTTRAVNNFAETPASGILVARGQRLRVTLFGDDSAAANMATGFTFVVSCNGGTNAADGDTYITLTENLTFVTEPAGTQVFLTDTASAVATAAVDREAWDVRGSGVQTDVYTVNAGPSPPQQLTDTAGGTVVDWYTKQLAAFTLADAVRCNIRGLMSGAGVNACWRVEIARVDSVGNNATVWGYTNVPNAMSFSAEAADSFLVSGPNMSISNGECLRIRLYIDDPDYGAMAAGTATLYYAGTSGGASGDTYVTFTQTLTEYVPSPSPRPLENRYQQYLAH